MYAYLLKNLDIPNFGHTIVKGKRQKTVTSECESTLTAFNSTFMAQELLQVNLIPRAFSMSFKQFQRFMSTSMSLKQNTSNGQCSTKFSRIQHFCEVGTGRDHFFHPTSCQVKIVPKQEFRKYVVASENQISISCKMQTLGRG